MVITTDWHAHAIVLWEQRDIWLATFTTKTVPVEQFGQQKAATTRNWVEKNINYFNEYD